MHVPRTGAGEGSVMTFKELRSRCVFRTLGETAAFAAVPLEAMRRLSYLDRIRGRVED
jgi:hypothetical protein